MSGEEGSLGDIRRALGSITRRLDALAAAVGAREPPEPEPPGSLLDEATRARLAPLRSLLGVALGVGRTEAWGLAVDRVLWHAGADAAVLLAPDGAGGWQAVAQRGFQGPTERLAAGRAGIVARAAGLGEPVQAGPGLGPPDAWLVAHGLGAAVAVPLVASDGAAVGVLLAGRRRAVPFEADALENLLVLATALVPAVAPPAPAPGPEARPPLLEPTAQPVVAAAAGDTARARLSDLVSLLAVVLGRLAAVRERLPDGEVARDLAVAEEAAWRAAGAVRSVLGFAPTQPEFRTAPLDLAALVRATVQAAEQRWAAEGAGPRVTVEAAAVPPVHANADELRHALDHLLQNAREAGAAAAPIVVRLHWDGGAHVEVAVIDHGRGMDEATRVRAGEPFFTTKGPGRLGVGLAVARAAAARHRGELAIETAPGCGTTVRLRLPAAAGTWRAPHAVARGPAPARPRLVLVVEDESAVREALVLGLARDDTLVRGADDIAAALNLLHREPVDAVVTDLALPSGSGLEVARIAKRLRPATAVVLMTAWPGRLEERTLETHGVDAVVEKPVGLDTLRTTLAALLARPGTPST
jgi:signal transduction histidine kinase